MSEQGEMPVADAILAAIEERMGWRARPGTLERIQADVAEDALRQNIGHRLGERPTRVWARPFQLKDNPHCVAVTAFWGPVDAVHVTSRLPK